MTYVPVSEAVAASGTPVIVSSGNIFIKSDDMSLGSDVLPLETRDNRTIDALNGIHDSLKDLGDRLNIIFDVD